MKNKGSDKTDVSNLINSDKGGQITVGNFQVYFPPDAFKSNTNVSSKKTDKSLTFITEIMQKDGISSDELVSISNNYDIDIGSIILSKPALIKTKYDISMIPADLSLDDLRFVQFRDGERFVLPTYVNKSEQTIYTETNHFSLNGLICIAGGFYIIYKATELYKGWCITKEYVNTDILEPEKVKDAKLRIVQDQDTKEMKLILEGKTLKGIDADKTVTRPSELLKKDNIEGICTDYAFLFGSLLIAKGYNVRLISGYAYHPDGKGGELSGYHMWVEVVIDKPYYIDTYNPSNIILVPLHEAYLKFKIKRVGHAIWKENKGGKYVGCKSYRHNPNWWKPYVKEKTVETPTQMYKRIEKAKKVLGIRQEEYLSKCKHLDNLRKSINNANSKKRMYKQIRELEKDTDNRYKQLHYASRNLHDMEKEIDSPWILRSENNENIEPIFSNSGLSVKNVIKLHDGLWNYEKKKAGNDVDSITLIDSVFSFSRTLFFEDVKFWQEP